MKDLPDLGRGLMVFYASNGNRIPSLPPDYPLFLSGRSGNPNLEPWRSKNYHLSYEWYFSDVSLFSENQFYDQNIFERRYFLGVRVRN